MSTTKVVRLSLMPSDVNFPVGGAAAVVVPTGDGAPKKTVLDA
jgi:hypothetical protein